MDGKLIIFTAPSGAGKTTIVRHMLSAFPQLAFSVSATSRDPRPEEVDGKDYYFITPHRFRELIEADAFLEWEEVYNNQFYGTLLSEVERIWADGKHIVFDIDVKGALNLKHKYPEQTLSVFVKPPSFQSLVERLLKRKTESPEQMQKRIQKAMDEMQFENQFDEILVNDELERTLEEAKRLVSQFLGIQ
jgi:guanylate kinase